MPQFARPGGSASDDPPTPTDQCSMRVLTDKFYFLPAPGTIDIPAGWFGLLKKAARRLSSVVPVQDWGRAFMVTSISVKDGGFGVDKDGKVVRRTGNTYEVSFNHFGVPTKVEYDTKGNILSAERETTVALLPMRVVKDLKARFPDMKINRVTEVNKKKKLYYVIRLESAGELHTVRFDTAGNMKRINKCEL